MTALSADAARSVMDWTGHGCYPVKAASQIYKGSIVTVDADGYAIAAADTADTWVVGVATENVLGGTADGDEWIRVEAGRAYLFAASSITQAMVGEPMYVVDDNTVDDSAGATNDVMVGLLVKYVSATSGWVFVAPTFSLGQIAGVTSSAGELNYLDITGAGTAQASKAVVLGASKEIATLGTVGSAAITVTSASATSLAVGRLGATTPAFTVDSSTGSQVAGLKVTGAATGGTVAVVATDSGADANLTINAKGAGTIGIGSVSTGAVTITPATTITGNATLSGMVTSRRNLVTAQATDTLTVQESGTTFICAVDAKLTLPEAVAGTEGVWYHIVTGVASAGTGVLVDPHANDAICYVTSVNNKDLINTPGTDVEGDSVTIVSDGAHQWWVESMIGIWAKE